MKIEVNINKKYFLAIIVSIVLLAGVFSAYAFNFGNSFKTVSQAAVFGHTADELVVSINGDSMTVQDAINLGKLGNGSGTGTVSGSFSNSISFIPNGSYQWIVPSGVSKIRVKVWGAGGGSSMGTQEYGGATGGGSGGYAEKILTVSSGTTYTISVGTGGSPGTNWVSPPDLRSDGKDGGTSSFSTLVSATGGKGGKAWTTTVALGGSGLNGDINRVGGSGGYAQGANGAKGGDTVDGLPGAPGAIEVSGGSGYDCITYPAYAECGRNIGTSSGASSSARMNPGASGANGAVIIDY